MRPELEQLLPWWVVSFPLLAAVALVPWSFAVLTLSMRAVRPDPKSFAEAPWYEQARTLYPAALTLRVGLMVCIGTGLFVLASMIGPSTWVPTWVALQLGLVMPYLGGLLAQRWLRSTYALPKLGLALTLRNTAGLLTLRTMPIVVLPLALFALPQQASVGSVALALGTGLLIAGWLFGGGLWVAKAVGLASAPGPKLQEALALAHAKTGYTPGLVAELSMGQANAFALPWARAIAVTRELIAVTTPEEIAAVLAHEIGHLREPKTALAFRTATVTLLLTGALLARWMTGALLAGFVATLLVIAIASRRFALKMEHHADAHVGHDDPVYALALEKLYQTNLAPAVTGLRLQTHPDLYDRMIAAGHPPSWPRPAKPSSGLLGRVVLVVLAGASVAPLLALNFVPEDWSKPAHPGSLESAQRAVALTGADGNSLIGVARGLALKGQRDDARVLALATAAAKPTAQWVVGNSFELLVELGFCDEARSVSGGAGLQEINEQWHTWVDRRLSDCDSPE